MHLANCPALPPPANAQARAWLATTTAPPIAYGTGFDNNNVAKARFEYKQRKLFHTKGLVTNTELLHARLRYVAIVNEYAAAIYPPTPESTLNEIRRLCARLENENSDHAAAIQDDVASVRCALDHADSVLNGTERSMKKQKRSQSRTG